MAGSAVAGSKTSSENARELNEREVGSDVDDVSGTATPTESIAEEAGEVDTDQGKLRALLGILRKVVGVKVRFVLAFPLVGRSG